MNWMGGQLNRHFKSAGNTTTRNRQQFRSTNSNVSQVYQQPARSEVANTQVKPHRESHVQKFRHIAVGDGFNDESLESIVDKGDPPAYEADPPNYKGDPSNYEDGPPIQEGCTKQHQHDAQTSNDNDLQQKKRKLLMKTDWTGLSYPSSPHFELQSKREDGFAKRCKVISHRERIGLGKPEKKKIAKLTTHDDDDFLMTGAIPVDSDSDRIDVRIGHVSEADFPRQSQTCDLLTTSPTRSRPDMAKTVHHDVEQDETNTFSQYLPDTKPSQVRLDTPSDSQTPSGERLREDFRTETIKTKQIVIGSGVQPTRPQYRASNPYATLGQDYGNHMDQPIRIDSSSSDLDTSVSEESEVMLFDVLEDMDDSNNGTLIPPDQFEPVEALNNAADMGNFWDMTVPVLHKDVDASKTREPNPLTLQETVSHDITEPLVKENESRSNSHLQHNISKCSELHHLSTRPVVRVNTTNSADGEDQYGRDLSLVRRVLPIQPSSKIPQLVDGGCTVCVDDTNVSLF